MCLLTQTSPPKPKGAFKALAFELKMRAVNLMSDFINLPQISRGKQERERQCSQGSEGSQPCGVRGGRDMEIRPAACHSLDPSKAKLGSNYQVI